MRFESIGPGPEEAARFDLLVGESPAFVKFHHPTCGHCIAMADSWASLKRESLPAQLIVIEVHAGAIPHIKSQCAKHVRGYPSVMHVHPGGRKAKEYSGDRTTRDLLKFIGREFKRKSSDRRRARRERRASRAQTAGGRHRRRWARRHTRRVRRRKSRGRGHPGGRTARRHRHGRSG
jgi:hypothetical protein